MMLDFPHEEKSSQHYFPIIDQTKDLIEYYQDNKSGNFFFYLVSLEVWNKLSQFCFQR